MELIIRLPMPGICEDLLDDEGAADEEADVDAEHGDRRDDGVAQHVPDEQPAGRARPWPARW